MFFDPTLSDLHLIWESFKDFEGLARKPDLDLNHFIEEWKERMAKVQSAGCQYSDLLLGLKLIEKVNLSHDSLVSVISKLSSSTSVSESFLTQVVSNIKELSEINGSFENRSLDLASLNIIKRDVDDQEISEELEIKSNMISCSKCPANFLDLESLTKHYHEFHPDMLNDMFIDSNTGIRSNCDDKNLIVKETFKKNLNYHNNIKYEFGESFVEQAWVDSPEVNAVSQMDAATLTPDVNIEIKIETSTEPVIVKLPDKVFKCEICSEDFPKLWKLNKHIRVHRTTKPYKCRYCDMSYKWWESLKSHMMRKHLEEQGKQRIVKSSDIQDKMDTSERSSKIQTQKNIFCRNSSVEQVSIVSSGIDPEVLKEETPSETKFECHEPKVERKSDKVFRCLICSEEYPKLWKLNKHMRIHRTIKNYMCPYCDMAYKWDNSLKSHLMRNHLEEQGKQKNQKSLVAPVVNDCSEKCTDGRNIHSNEKSIPEGKDLDSSSKIKKEDKTALNSNTDGKEAMEIFPCEFCGISFSKYNLKKHIDNIHSAKNFKCVDCPKEFAKINWLERHMKTHDTTIDCSICHKTLKSSQALRSHIESHKTTRDYVCSYCGKDFKTLNVFKEHLNVHTKEKPLPCNFCDKIFFERSSRRFHIRKHHTGEKPYKCDFCEKRFFSSSKRADHIRTHTGEKPFPCQVCGKCFRETNTLKRHVRNVHKIVDSRKN